MPARLHNVGVESGVPGRQHHDLERVAAGGLLPAHHQVPPPSFALQKTSYFKCLFIVAIIVTMFVISITFTALIVTELFMVAIQINRWHFLMVSS